MEAASAKYVGSNPSSANLVRMLGLDVEREGVSIRSGWDVGLEPCQARALGSRSRLTVFVPPRATNRFHLTATLPATALSALETCSSIPGNVRRAQQARLWRNAWSEFVPFLERPVPRRDQATRTLPRRAVGDESPLPGGVASRSHRPNFTGRIAGWKNILNVLSMTYGDRPGLN